MKKRKASKTNPPKEIKKLKVALLEEKKSLEEELKDFENKPLDFGSDVDSFETETEETEEFSNRIGLIQVLKNRLSDINEGIKRIIAGDYGRCEKCGANISLRVFLASPSSRLCQECKKKK